LKKSELEGLLLTFSYKEENKNEAQRAFELFYREYSKYLYKVVYEAKKSAPYFYNELIDIVVGNVFIKIYNKPLDFIISEDETDEDVDKKMKGYLAKIAKNELYTLLKKEYCKQEHRLIIDDDESFFEPPQVVIQEDVKLSHSQKLLNEVLYTFSERDRLIILSIYDYHQEGKNCPKEIMDWLVQTHKTSSVNIRKIKSRCDKKIIEYFEKHSTLKPLKR
jgi:DNA-directed RNA polymerase specialized sigma24 family protein